MKEKVFLFLQSILSGNYAEIGFIISVLGVITVFVVGFLLSAIKRDFNLKKRLILHLFNLPFCAINLVFFNNGGARIFLLTLCFSLVVMGLTLMVKTKPAVRKTEKNPTKIPCDNLPFNVGAELPKKPVEIIKNPIISDDSCAPKKTNADFTHVKNVIERLRAFPLSTGDKKQIKDLEDAIVLIENGLEDEYSINDELGALLKIMAKYGV